MIHAADAQTTVANAGGDARAEHGADQLTVGGNVVVTGMQRCHHGTHACIETALYMAEVSGPRQFVIRLGRTRCCVH
jgi:hypothetical protein